MSVIDAKEENMVRAFKLIPYDKIAEVLKNDGTAFLEEDGENPLKRQTMWKASKKLSSMLGKKVGYFRTLYHVGNDIYMKGWSFQVDES